MEDPFFTVKDDIQRTVAMTDSLFHRWCELTEDHPPVSTPSPTQMCNEEFDWTTNELRNCLRSIDWDLEDLEETIVIAEKNQKKLKLDSTELNARRLFITQTRSAVKGVRDRMQDPSSLTSHITADVGVGPALSNISVKPTRGGGGERGRGGGYRRLLANEPDVIEQALVSNQIYHERQPHSVTNHNHQLLAQNTNNSSTVTAGGPLNSSRGGFKDLDEQTVMLHDDQVDYESTSLTLVSIADTCQCGSVLRSGIQSLRVSRVKNRPYESAEVSQFNVDLCYAVEHNPYELVENGSHG